ncbi:BolA family protein [Candidatus Vallotia lariciata]|uniref:BolA family protein n=1 Tax=Candidatus Vallotia laricis TaxID=2018052 RepID=UPI001D00D2D9|nr:BolA family protein [Candidatus Vallotia lariciata]UDG83033.1 DNA-binding transcriptional regulator BolA [Candidatus Vallotia lariciata]
MNNIFLAASPDRRIELIRDRLSTTLSPFVLEIQDNSLEHAEHAGAATGSHYSVTIVSAVFDGHTRVDRHRLVYSALRNEMQKGIHALSINAYTPKEFDSK